MDIYFVKYRTKSVTRENIMTEFGKGKFINVLVGNEVFEIDEKNIISKKKARINHNGRIVETE